MACLAPSMRMLRPLSSSYSLSSKLLKDWNSMKYVLRSPNVHPSHFQPRLVATSASKKDVMRKPADSTQLDDLKGILLRGLLSAEPKKAAPKPKKVAPVAPSPKKSNKKKNNVDWLEKADTHVIRAYLPGLSKDDVNIAVAGRTIDVSTRERQAEETKSDEVKWHMRCALWQSSFSHKFELPEGVKMSEMVARWENEVLTITIPKEPCRHMESIKIL